MPPFYTRIEPDPALARGYVYMLDAIDAYVAKGRIAEATRARAALQRMWREYEQLSIRAATQADAFIRARIKATAVRPPTSGRLEGGIKSLPLPSTFPAGAIGIADLSVLERAAVNPRSGGVYWRAQEYGLPVDPNARPVPGYFMPGYSRPNQGDYRMHPYFEQMGYARGMPALVRTQPLAARHYLRDGTQEVAAWHRLESARINRRAISALATL